MSEMTLRKNVYMCDRCGLPTVTVDLESGVTPFMLNCRANGEGMCAGTARSLCYHAKSFPAHLPAPSFEWFKPRGSEYRKLNKAMREHVDLGGLDIRPITATTMEALEQ
jgi:hypothetical protein